MKEKYLIVLAAVAGVALFLVGVYVMEFSHNDEEDDSGDMIETAFTISDVPAAVGDEGAPLGCTSGDDLFVIADAPAQCPFGLLR